MQACNEDNDTKNLIIIVGQAYRHVMKTMLSNVKYITIVMPKNKGMKRSMFAWSVDA